LRDFPSHANVAGNHAEQGETTKEGQAKNREDDLLVDVKTPDAPVQGVCENNYEIGLIHRRPRPSSSDAPERDATFLAPAVSPAAKRLPVPVNFPR
jgi:hypothetical protein